MTARTWRPDGPGSHQSPPGVRHVRDTTGTAWTRDGARWTCDRKAFIRWRDLVGQYGPITEETR
ncbi:hypothetical protein [Streptomyces turgidiscabies]|uniref:hypothetical protein n=1 Tax=Streptomyces turgidiscabies TaxID=85558 RepID=UPI0038F6F3A7